MPIYSTLVRTATIRSEISLKNKIDKFRTELILVIIDTSVLSGLIIFPINLIQTRLVVQPFDNRRYSGFTDAVYKIVSSQGLKGLWRGISFTLSGNYINGL